jgi:hypothetical protein
MIDEPRVGEDLGSIFRRIIQASNDLAERVMWLERVQPVSHLTYKDPYVTAKEDAAKAQATENLYAPLRSDTRAVVDLAAFARRLLNPQDLAHAVTLEVRNAARRALGMPEVKEYDL